MVWKVSDVPSVMRNSGCWYVTITSAGSRLLRLIGVSSLALACGSGNGSGTAGQDPAGAGRPGATQSDTTQAGGGEPQSVAAGGVQVAPTSSAISGGGERQSVAAGGVQVAPTSSAISSSGGLPGTAASGVSNPSAQSGGHTGASTGQGATCADAVEYSGDPGWGNSVSVTASARYCASFDENRASLLEEYAAKGRFFVRSGQYAVPDQPTSDAGIRLPLCVETPQGSSILQTGTIGCTRNNWSSSAVRYSYVIKQEAVALGRQLELYLTFFSNTGASGSFVLDGSHPNPESVGRFTPMLCGPSDSCSGPDTLIFDACSDANWITHRHRVTFDQGELEVLLQLGTTSGGTEPGAFVRARGTFQGTPFDQTDYYHLVYHPTHHHLTRSFAVLFESSIAGACGLEVSGIDGGLGLQQRLEAYTIDCNLKRIDALTNPEATKVE